VHVSNLITTATAAVQGNLGLGTGTLRVIDDKKRTHCNTVVVWPLLKVYTTSQPSPGPKQLRVKPAFEAVGTAVTVLSIRAPVSMQSDY
jgi:hypothetical protein